MAGELRALGATLLELNVQDFAGRDDVHIRRALDTVRSFRPDLAIALPNAGYAFLCVTADGKNVFRDVLELPTILIWDHGALQFSQLILAPLPKRADHASGGCIERLRRALSHPLFVHYSPDKGHIEAMDALGILDAARVRSFVHFAFPVYTREGHDRAATGSLTPRLAFAGNVYLEGSRKLPYRDNAILAGIESRMLEAKRANITASFWHLVLAELERYDRRTLKKLALQPDSTFFWSFVHDEIEIVGNTEARLGMLGALQHECEFFGNFVEPQMASVLRRQYGLRLHEPVDCLSGLPSLYRNSELIIDVINAGYISGTSPKVTSCLAAGGLILFDRKQDFKDEFGEIADLVMYRSHDHLHSLIEEYLGHPQLRREASGLLRERVMREFTFTAFSRRVLADEPAWCAVRACGK
jgi:Glycosyl transferases group 1